MTGTFDISDITLYRMDGEFYARSKSTLTGKRVKKDKVFEGTRRSSERFKRGNELASQVYQSMLEENRFYKLYCRLKREAILYLKCGKSEEEVVKELELICANPNIPTCHLNLSLPATARPVLYRDWYRQKEKVYEYNYDSHKSPKRKQRIVYFEGSEHLPLNLSTQDIVDITEGTETDMLNVIKKMEERLKRKQRTTTKKAAAVQQEKQVETQEKPPPAHTPKHILPKFTRSIVALPRAESETCNSNFRISSRRKVSRQALFRKNRSSTNKAALNMAIRRPPHVETQCFASREELPHVATQCLASLAKSKLPGRKFMNSFSDGPAAGAF